MAAHGLHQPGDFQFVLAGAHPQRWEALKAGTLDAAIQLVPFNYVAEEAGFPNLGDVDDYVPDFLFCAVCTRLSWAQAHPKQLTGLLRAFRRGAEVLYGDPEAAGRRSPATRRAIPITPAGPAATSSPRRRYRKI